MLRLLLLVPLIYLQLLACDGEYTSCIKKIKDSNTIHNNSLYIPIKNNRLLVHTTTTPKAKTFKYNPFFSLYIIENNSSFDYPFDVNMRLDSKTAVCNTTTSTAGSFKTKQIGLDKLATYSKELLYPSILLSACCNIEGIVTPNGIIEKEYIYNFIASDSEYSDIGVRVEDENDNIIVYAKDPFVKDNPLHKGDCIVELDGKSVKNSADFMKRVLFSNIGSKHIVKVKRDSNILFVTTHTYKRYGGGDISDTFLEQLGIYFDKNLIVTAVSEENSSYGILVGDKLLQVNAKEVQTQKETLSNMDNFKYTAKLLFARKGFHYFVRLNK